MSQKIKLRAKELKKAKASFISLVKSPANKTPILLLKSESNMSLLDKMRKSFKKSEDANMNTSQVMAFILNSGAALSEDKLSSSGYSVVEKKELDEGSVFIVSDKFDLSDPTTALVESDDGVIVALSNFDKEFIAYESTTDFSSKVLALGFYPSLETAKDTLSCVIYDISRDESLNKEQSQEKVEACLSDFHGYVSKAFQAIPSEFFFSKNVAKNVEEETSDNSGKESEAADLAEKIDKMEEIVSGVNKNLQALSLENKQLTVKLASYEKALEGMVVVSPQADKEEPISVVMESSFSNQ